MSEQQKYQFNVFYIAVLFIWPVLKSLYLNIDGADRISCLLTVLAIIVNYKSLFKGPASMKIWLLWVIYSIVNVLLKGYSNNGFPFLWWSLGHLICPFISMIVVYNSILYKGDIFLKCLVIFYLVYVLLGVFNMEVGDDLERMENALGNNYINNAIFFMPFILMYSKTNRIPAFIMFFLIAYVFFFIVMSGERKGLAGFFIMIVGMFVARRFQKESIIKMGSIVAIVAILAISSYGALYLMDNTFAGDRVNQQFQNTQYSDNLFLTLMGDRAFMYQEGIATFFEQPLTGIGLTNFRNSPLNPMGLMLHSEYMAELAENGIIGSMFFLTLYIGMIVGLIKIFRSRKAYYEAFVLGSALLAVIEIDFYTWTYSYRYYFMLFGLVYATCDYLNENS